MQRGLRERLRSALRFGVVRGAFADDNWWPAKVYNFDSGSQKVDEYTPLDKAAKPWNICVLFPHMKDTLLGRGRLRHRRGSQAHGRQHDALSRPAATRTCPSSCRSSTIAWPATSTRSSSAPISEAGLDKKFAEGVKAGKVVISTVNPRRQIDRDLEDDRRLHGHGRADRRLSGRLPQRQDGQCRDLPGPAGLRLGRGVHRRLQEGGEGQEQRQGARRQVRRFRRRRATSA